MKKSETREARRHRHQRVRQKVSGNGNRPRLAVFRSLNHIYAQVIDDTRGHTLAAASTLDPELRKNGQGQTKTDRAGQVGELLAQRASEKGISEVSFDRGGFKYHGRVKALAEGARKGGLKF